MFKVNEIRVNGHDQDIWGVAWRGSTLATCSLDQTVRLWSPGVATGRRIAQLPSGVCSVDISRDSSTIVCCSLDATITMLRLIPNTDNNGNNNNNAAAAAAAPTSNRTSLSNAGDALCVRISPDARRLLTSSRNGSLTEHDLSTWPPSLHRTLDPPRPSPTLAAAYCPLGVTAASGSADGSVALFDLTDGRRLHRLDAHGKAVRRVAFSGDGTLLAAASDDGQVSVWDARRGGLVHAFTGHKKGALAVQFAGNMLATGAGDGAVRLWEVVGRQLLHTFSEHKAPVWGVAFNDDGKKLASCGEDRMLVVYDIQ